MPLAFVVIGILAVAVAINGTQATLMKQLASDFTGSGSFIYWIAAIVVLGIVGKVSGLENTAKAFIGLILAVYLVSNTGVWSQAQSALSSLQAPGASTSTAGSTTAVAAPTTVAVLSPAPAATATPGMAAVSSGAMVL